MKNQLLKTLVTLIVLLSVAACNIKTKDAIQREGVTQARKDIIQKYDAVSNANSKSDFGVKNRKVEIEYKQVEIDSSLDMHIRITSGYNEGEILEQLIITTENNEVLPLTAEQVLSREYVEEYNYTTTTPITKQKFINDPGGVDVVIQPDGTAKHVHRAASTKTVNSTENQVINHSGSKSQIYNELKINLDRGSIPALKSISYFTLKFQNCSIKINPSKRQKIELSRYL